MIKEQLNSVEKNYDELFGFFRVARDLKLNTIFAFCFLFVFSRFMFWVGWPNQNARLPKWTFLASGVIWLITIAFFVWALFEFFSWIRDYRKKRLQWINENQYRILSKSSLRTGDNFFGFLFLILIVIVHFILPFVYSYWSYGTPFYYIYVSTFIVLCTYYYYQNIYYKFKYNPEEIIKNKVSLRLSQKVFIKLRLIFLGIEMILVTSFIFLPLFIMDLFTFLDFIKLSK